MKAFIRSFFAAFLALVVLLLLGVGIFASQAQKKTKIDSDSWLVLDVYGNIPEYPAPGGLIGEILGDEPETLHRILTNLAKAEVDERIAGVIMRLSASNNIGWASIEEIRAAIKRLQTAGKPVYGFSDNMDKRTYFLAAACDSIFAPPSADISFMGFATISTHIHGTLDKLGINPNLHQIREYKAAAELLTREDMSPPVRENRDWMLQEYWENFLAVLEQDRGLTKEAVERIMDKALLTAEEAVAADLFDRLLYWDHLENQLKRAKDDELKSVAQSRYAQEDATKLGLKGKKKIVVIHVNGFIGGRESRIDPLLGVMIGHETVTRDLRRARNDDEVAAVVLRVDSQGGESLTGDLISRAVAWTVEMKPVIVSMVDVAASGGYGISYKANRIVANPLTVTGSIGSISAKFNMQSLYEKLGISHDYVTKGPMALFNVDFRDFTAQEWERFQQNHWESFNIWLRDIADHRNMTPIEVEQLAFGRVWTGRQAVVNGLVDQLGGLDRAVAVAKELADIPSDEQVTLVHLPEKRDLLDMIFSSDDEQTGSLSYLMRQQLAKEFAVTQQLLTSARWRISDVVMIR